MHGRRPRDWSRLERESRVFARRFERQARAAAEELGGDDVRSMGGARGVCGWGLAMGFDGGERHGMRQAGREARRARYEARHETSGADAGCSVYGSPFGRWVACWWWLVFPLWGMATASGGFPRLGAGLEGLFTGLLELTLVAPLARMVAQSVGVTYVEAFGLLALSATITAGAAMLAWRAGAPRRT